MSDCNHFTGHRAVSSGGLRGREHLRVTDYKNIQVQDVVTGAINLVNAAAATMKGIDVDFAFLPIDAVTVHGGFEMMSGHYMNFKNAPFYSLTLGPSGAPVGGNTQRVGNATGFDTVRTPKGTATVSVAYRVSAPRGSLSFVVSDYYNSGFSWDPDDRLRQSSFEVVSASVDWNAPKNGWSVRLGGSNLTDTQRLHGRADASQFMCSRATANLRHDAERELLSSCCRSTSFLKFRAGPGCAMTCGADVERGVLRKPTYRRFIVLFAPVRS
jgi:hypothetical protein